MPDVKLVSKCDRERNMQAVPFPILLYRGNEVFDAAKLSVYVISDVV